MEGSLIPVGPVLVPVVDYCIAPLYVVNGVRKQWSWTGDNGRYCRCLVS